MSTMVHPRQRQASRIAPGHSDSAPQSSALVPSLSNQFVSRTWPRVDSSLFKFKKTRKNRLRATRVTSSCPCRRTKAFWAGAIRAGEHIRRHPGYHSTLTYHHIRTPRARVVARKFQPVPWLCNFLGTGRQPPATPCWPGACKPQHHWHRMTDDARATGGVRGNRCRGGAGYEGHR